MKAIGRKCACPKRGTFRALSGHFQGTFTSLCCRGLAANNCGMKHPCDLTEALTALEKVSAAGIAAQLDAVRAEETRLQALLRVAKANERARQRLQEGGGEK